MKKILITAAWAMFSSIAFAQQVPDTAARTDQYGKKVDRTPLIRQSVLKLREVYRHISNMSDRADAAADALGMAIIKLS